MESMSSIKSQAYLEGFHLMSFMHSKSVVRRTKMVVTQRMMKRTMMMMLQMIRMMMQMRRKMGLVKKVKMKGTPRMSLRRMVMVEVGMKTMRMRMRTMAKKRKKRKMRMKKMRKRFLSHRLRRGNEARMSRFSFVVFLSFWLGVIEFDEVDAWDGGIRVSLSALE